MEKSKQKWSDLELKTRIAYATAIASFVLGWVLTIAGFYLGQGQVHDSVLWILGQSLLYSASVLGVGMYVTNSVRSLKRDVRQFMEEEDRRYRTELQQDEPAETQQEIE